MQTTVITLTGKYWQVKRLLSLAARYNGNLKITEVKAKC